VPAHHDDFAEFYQASYGRMVGLVAALVGDRSQAEDIAQEAFSRALTRWPRIARYDLPEAWVRRVALRLTVDATRRMRRADLPVDDIARDCGISVGTVRTRLAAARHRLYRDLRESDEEVPNAR
jgi:DNA-directed RNA polymerase specialized sigma24 family protein